MIINLVEMKVLVCLGIQSGITGQHQHQHCRQPDQGVKMFHFIDSI
jgi:hypothetical protein